MTSRAGGAPIRTSKVKPGPDQAFTLQKGTSAAPIMQVKVKPKNIKQTKKPEVLSKKVIADVAGVAAGVVAEKKFNLYDKAKKALKELITLEEDPKTKTGPKRARKAKKPKEVPPKPVEVRRGGAIRRRGGGIAKRGMGIAK